MSAGMHVSRTVRHGHPGSAGVTRCEHLTSDGRLDAVSLCFLHARQASGRRVDWSHRDEQSVLILRVSSLDRAGWRRHCVACVACAGNDQGLLPSGRRTPAARDSIALPACHSPQPGSDHQPVLALRGGL